MKTKEEKKAYNKKWREDNPEYSKKWYDENKEKIKACSKKYRKKNKEKIKWKRKKYNQKHKDKIKEYNKKYQKKHKEKIKWKKKKYNQEHKGERKAYYEKSKDKRKEAYLNRVYNLNIKDYDKILKQQGGVCAICRKKETNKRNGKTICLSVDHCHQTGEVRGLLCIKCNIIIGNLKEDISLFYKCIKYLKNKK